MLGRPSERKGVGLFVPQSLLFALPGRAEEQAHTPHSTQERCEKARAQAQRMKERRAARERHAVQQPAQKSERAGKREKGEGALSVHVPFCVESWAPIAHSVQPRTSAPFRLVEPPLPALLAQRARFPLLCCSFLRAPSSAAARPLVAHSRSAAVSQPVPATSLLAVRCGGARSLFAS